MNNTQQYTQPALVLGEIGLVHNLGEAGVPVYLGSEIRDNPSLYSRYPRDHIFFSKYTSSQFIEELCEFGERLDQKAVIFSDDDHAILNITQHQERLEEYFYFSFPTEDIVKRLLDKQLFCEFIEDYNLPAPASLTLSSMEDFREKPLSELRFPCIIKPSYKQAWWDSDFGQKVGEYQKAIKCETYEELQQRYEQIAQVNPHVVVQEFIEGEEEELYSVNMYVDEDHDLRGYFIAQKLRTYPIKAGEGCYIKTVQDTEMIAVAMTIVDKLKLKGLLNIQFKRDERTGKPVLLEIHTRNSVWSYLGTAAGVNLARMYYEDLTGHALETVPSYETGVSFVFLEKDIKAFFQNIRTKRVPVVHWLRTYFQKMVIAGYKWSDPLPFFMTIGFFMRRRLKALKTFLFY